MKTKRNLFNASTTVDMEDDGRITGSIHYELSDLGKQTIAAFAKGFLKGLADSTGNCDEAEVIEDKEEKEEDTNN